MAKGSKLVQILHDIISTPKAVNDADISHKGRRASQRTQDSSRIFVKLPEQHRDSKYYVSFRAGIRSST